MADISNNVAELQVTKKMINNSKSDQDSMVLCRDALTKLLDAIYIANDIDIPKSATLLEKIDSKVVQDYFNDAIIIGSLHYARKIGVRAYQGQKIKKTQAKIAKDIVITAIGYLVDKTNGNATTGIVAPAFMTEADTRREYIDLYLNEAGWDVIDPTDTTVLPDGTKVKSGHLVPGKACSEIPVKGMKNVTGIGFCDYVLYGKNGKPLAIVEAKRTSVSAEKGRQQVKDYGECMEKQYGYTPVLYYTNGYEINIIDGLYPSRRVASFHTEAELELLIQRRNKKPIALSDLQINDNITNRPYQKRAITATCERFGKLHRRSLLVMATGTGKTRVAISLVDVLSRNLWVKNVLFLADRVTLVRQAFKNFNKLLPDKTYNVLSDPSLANHPNARITLSTHQTMINYIDSEDKEFSIGRYDLIIVDEAHRSIFKKYGSIFEYFDCLMVGLTATPKDDVDSNTYQIFNCENGEPTFTYSFNEAVSDKYLVDYKLSNKTTVLMSEGISYSQLSSEDKEKVDTVYEDASDSTIIYEPDQFRKVFNVGTCRTVLNDLMTSGLKVNGGQDIGKTIIFAVNHKHAQLIVDTFKKTNPQYGDDYCTLIDNEVKGAQDLIEKFDQHEDIRIAVSVDMMDTGVDVPSVLNLVFFKKVRSKIKFFQMIGRGTRLCEGLIDGYDKDHFLIFDYCGNFEYFDTHPEGEEGDVRLSLSQKLFKTKLDLLIELQKYEHQIIPEQKAYYESLKPVLYSKIVELKKLSNNKVSVRNKMEYVDKYCNKQKWDAISLLEQKEIEYHLAPLVENDVDQDSYALSFDYKILLIELGILVDASITNVSPIIKRVRDISKTLLDEKGSLEEVQSKAATLIKLADVTFWNSVPAIDTLEKYRDEIRSLMKYLKDKSPRVIIDTVDTSIDKPWVPIQLQDIKTYKEKVMDYLFENSDSPTIMKIKNLEYLDESDFSELERVMWRELGTKEDYEKITHISNLAAFIRSIVGIEQKAVNEKFGEYLSENILTSAQQEFIYSIINYVRENGDITPQVILKQKPFSTQNLNQLFGSNSYVVSKVISTMHNTVTPQA